MTYLINTLATLLTLGVVAWASDFVRWVGIQIYTEQYIAVLLALALPLTYLHIPARRSDRVTEGGGRGRRGPVPWYDALAAAVGCAASLYVAIHFPELSEETTRHPLNGLIVAAVTCLLFVEGLRRTSGLAITCVAVAFFCLALLGVYLPDPITGRPVMLDFMTYFLLWDSSAMLGTPMQIVTTVVITFVLFGNALFKTGGAAFFTDISMALMGRFRGGPAKIAIMASSLFGTISGSVVANVVTTGVVTIPLMKRAGFRPQLAGAVEAVSSTGGQLMPPVMGIAAFLMAEFLQIPYATVALSALIPAVLFYLALFLQADFEAARGGLTHTDPAQIPRARDVLRTGWYFPIPFVVLIGALFWFNYQPDDAALLATASVLVLSLVFGISGKRVGLVDLYQMLRNTGLTVLDLFMIGAAAGIVIASLSYSGLGFGFTLALVHLAGGNLIALLVIAAIACIILGMGMPTVGVYILLATLIAPALIQMKIQPIAAHMFILYYGCLSMITPPVAIGAFAAANLAGADPMRTGFEAVRFGWLVFVIPFLFVFSGTLLMHGEPLAIAVDFVVAVVGVWFGAAGVTGYASGPLRPALRAAFILAGICLLIPFGAFEAAHWVNLFGAALGVTLFVIDRAQRRRMAPSAVMHNT